MKKLFPLVLAVLCLVLVFSLTATAQEPEVVHSGKFGSNETADNVTWTLYSDGTLIFSGTGATRDSQTYSSESWGSSLTDIRHIIVEEGITYLGDYMFYNDFDHRYVETITLPTSLQKIGQGAFSGMPSLKGVYISDLAAWCRIQFEDTEANPLCNQVDLYLNGEAVVDLVIPESITEIPNCAFYGSAGIHTVTLHKNVKKIGDFAFNSASCLKHMIFQGGEVTFGRHVFTLSELTIHYPAGIPFWDQLAAESYDKNLSYAPYEGKAPVLPEDPPCHRIIWDFDPDTGTLTLSGYGHTGDFYSSNTTSVRPEWDFYSKYITTVIVEEGITGLGEHTFQRCQDLTSVSLPSTLQSIGGHCFDQCIALTDLSLPEGLTKLGQSALSGTAISSAVIPKGITTIPSSLFEGCGALRTVTLHDGITAIADAAFRGCGIRELELPVGLTMLGSSAFENAPLEHITIPNGVAAIYMHTFSGCSELTNVQLPEGLTEIGEYAFRGCASLTEINLPDSLLKLGTQAFVYSGLTDVTVPASLSEYDRNALGYISNITFTGRAPEFAEDCFVWQEVTIYYPAGYTSWTEDVLQQYGGTVTWVPYETDLPEPGGHVHAYTEHSSSFCDSWGVYYYICECGDYYEGEVVPPQGHEWGPWKLLWEASETQSGMQEHTCRVCDLTETQEIPPGVDTFTDVNRNDYFYIPVRWAKYRQITSGTTATTFSPNAPCTRAQVVTFLWRLSNCPEPASTQNPFSDVKKTDYYYKAVLWAVENGITSGTGGGKFSPDATCTRGQVVTFLHRFCGSAEPWGQHLFTDITESDYFYNAVLWCNVMGITQGTSKTTFSPNAPCTRGQVVTFLYRTANR